MLRRTSKLVSNPSFKCISVQRFLSSSSFIKIVEVSPRDGLQNEPNVVPTVTKLELISRLTATGLQAIEVTSFVSPKWIPQMSDNSQLYAHVLDKFRGNGVKYPILIPNTTGLETALKVADVLTTKIEEIAIFGAASEKFSAKNTNRSIEEGFKAFEEVIHIADQHDIPVRAYLSTVIACPYDGPTRPSDVAKYTKRFLDMGCYEVSLGDTIGVGTPATIRAMLEETLKVAPSNKLAIHAHDTYGQGVANVLEAVKMGIRVVDSSVAGLGGCPYAKGATGNVSTEDVVYALNSMGFDTGIDLNELSRVGVWISDQLGRTNGSRAGKAIAFKPI